MKKSVNIILCLIIIMLSQKLLANDMYKCQKKNGEIRYSDDPCYQNEKTLTIKGSVRVLKDGEMFIPPKNTKTESDKKNYKFNNDNNMHQVTKDKIAKTKLLQLLDKNISPNLSGLTKSHRNHPLRPLFKRLSELDLILMLIIFSIFPVLSLIIGFIHGQENGYNPPWNYIYSLISYISIFTGLLWVATLMYSLIFLLTYTTIYNLIICIIPIVSMILTLILIKIRVHWEDVPGILNVASHCFLVIISYFIPIILIEYTSLWRVLGSSTIAFAVLSTTTFVLLRFALVRI